MSKSINKTFKKVKIKIFLLLTLSIFVISNMVYYSNSALAASWSPTPTPTPCQIILEPSEDAWTKGTPLAAHDNNYGNVSWLETDADHPNIIWLKFKLPSNIDPTRINKAWLSMRLNPNESGNGDDGGNVYLTPPSSNNWSETTITFKNQPSINTYDTSVPSPLYGIGETTTFKRYNWNLSRSFTRDTFNNRLNGSFSIFTFIIKSTAVNGSGYYSKDNTTDVDNFKGHPRLFLNFSTCVTPTPTPTPLNLQGWWQAKNADIISGGNLSSQIPSTCTGTCIPNLVLDGGGGFPGIISYKNSYDFADGASKGTASSKQWLVEDQIGQPPYKYSNFALLVHTNTIFNIINGGAVDGSYFNSGGQISSDGYYWYKKVGDLTIDNLTSNINLSSRKVILLVEKGDLDISSEIHFSQGSGFFMAIVGKDISGKGNINIDPSIGKSGNPSLEGIFSADRNFSTGSGNKQLWVRGAVSAESINLQRNLGAENQTSPSEFFEYGADVIMNYPQSLSRKHIAWKEIAP